jgi:pimeloyl-ACP methyl ester carboxylesterase
LEIGLISRLGNIKISKLIEERFMEKINVKDIQLAYDRRGKGTPLVLLHGYPLDHHLWDEIIPLLEDTFDVISPDLRGFGESTIADSSPTMEDYAADIAGLLDYLKIQKAAIVGHSMGGYVALAFARLYPERVGSLGLVSSQVLADPPDRKEGRYKSAADVAENGIASVVATMTPKFTSDENLQGFARISMERQPPAAYIAALKAMAERLDSTPLLSSLNVPVVIVHGDSDLLIPVDRAREVKATLPQAHLVEISGAGHMPMMESREKTAQALKQLA